MNRRQVNIVLGNREEALNEYYVQAIRQARPDIEFIFNVATTVPDFIRLACDNRSDLALFMPPGNIASDPARPDATPQEDAVHIVTTIKAMNPISVIVVAASPVAAEALLAAGADQFIHVPAMSAEIESALAACLKL